MHGSIAAEHSPPPYLRSSMEYPQNLPQLLIILTVFVVIGFIIWLGFRYSTHLRQSDQRIFVSSPPSNTPLTLDHPTRVRLFIDWRVHKQRFKKSNINPMFSNSQDQHINPLKHATLSTSAFTYATFGEISFSFRSNGTLIYTFDLPSGTWTLNQAEIFATPIITRIELRSTSHAKSPNHTPHRPKSTAT